MDVETFFNLFVEELKENKALTRYYKYNNNTTSFEFRKAYFIQRLQYIQKHITNKNSLIWDCGCGYGTSAIFLALNGYTVTGNTLEFYYNQIPSRIKYWSQFGDISSFTYSYENSYEKKFEENSLDYILVQDTLHHLEPFQDILQIFKKALKLQGKLVAIEENGNNIIIRANRFRQRGNNRIVEMYDEKLGKNILIGNENIRSYKKWNTEFNKAGFQLADEQYIRFYMPYKFKNGNSAHLIDKEQALWKKNSFLREYFFFGLNFTSQYE